MDKARHVPPTVANRQAYHNYFIHETYECGLVLTGTEVKSIRAGKANLKDSYARIKDGELWLWNAHISPYEQGNRFNAEPLRTRKLLMHRREIRRLEALVKTQGYTLIPLRLYFKHGRVKCEVGLAIGKKLYDKRQDMAARAVKRDLERRIKEQRYD
ncbi:MAG: SsrA-binding protein SmpB [Dialister sp.]|nr:SsrA-binding protein SmpB [Dialister sp.]